MKILELFTRKQNDYYCEKVPTIAFLGDSVTHGCFEIFVRDEKLETRVDTPCGYHEKIRKIFNVLYPDVPVNIINAGISGDCAKDAQYRVERDVLNYKPDLVIVCFGLNDAMQEEEGLFNYALALENIFKSIKESGADLIFMTPNMRTNHISKPFSEQMLLDAQNLVIKNEEEKWLDTYLEEAKKVCEKQNVRICDCNAIWKKLTENGVLVNNLLSNRINHPTEQMHWLFAYELVRNIFNI